MKEIIRIAKKFDVTWELLQKLKKIQVEPATILLEVTG